MRCWGRLDLFPDPAQLTQQDALEFINAWLNLLQSDGFNMRWEKRLEQTGNIAIFDCGATTMPICIRIDDQLVHSYTCDLTQLLYSWRQADGMVTALTVAPPCLIIQLDRTYRDQQDALQTSACQINLESSCRIPVFQDSALHWEYAEYEITALMCHTGLDGAGHYRSAMRLSPSLVNATTPAEWLITDDWLMPKTAWRVPNWMQRQATIFWLVRTDTVHLPRYVPAGVHDEHMADPELRTMPET